MIQAHNILDLGEDGEEVIDHHHQLPRNASMTTGLAMPGRQ